MVSIDHALHTFDRLDILCLLGEKAYEVFLDYILKRAELGAVLSCLFVLEAESRQVVVYAVLVNMCLGDVVGVSGRGELRYVPQYGILRADAVLRCEHV